MEDQAKHIYKKVEMEDIVNVDTIKQEIEVDNLDKMDETDGEINPYHEIITNKVEKMIQLYHRWKSGQFLAMYLIMYSTIGIQKNIII